MSLDGIPIADLSPWGLVGMFVLLVAFGRLKPKVDLDRVERDRDHWRAAHTTSEVARAELAQSVHDLLEIGRTTDAFIRSLPLQPDQSHSNGGKSVREKRDHS